MASIIMISCSSHDSGIDRIVAERDSLRQVAHESQLRLEDINGAMEILTTSLDSIVSQEGILLVNKDPEGNIFSRREMRQRIDDFASLIERQRQRIAELSHRLSEQTGNGADWSRLSALVDNLNAQLDAKESQISRLRSELTDKNVRITHLNNKVAELTENISALEISNTQLDEALTMQDVVINEGYFIAGDSKFLSQQGILSGGFLKKKKLQYDSFQPGNFLTVDIRHDKVFTREAKKAKLLTPAPAGTYEITKEGKDIVLRIIDPTKFWSLSNYHVLQLN